MKPSKLTAASIALPLCMFYCVTNVLVAQPGSQASAPPLVPFLVIDLVIASVLMSMGMMMLPPVIVSLPFKLIFFVLVDGWSLVAGSLVQSFGS